MCHSCAAHKHYKHKDHGFLRPHNLTPLRSYEPFAHIQVDNVDPLPLTALNERYACVATCHSTKYKVDTPMPDHLSLTVSNTLYGSVYSKFSPPLVLVTDQGSEFTGEVTRHLSCRLKIDHRFLAANHHQTVAEPETFTKFL